MADEKKEREIQARLMEFQILQGTHQALRQRIETAIQHSNELNHTKLALEELGNTKPGPALIPMGSDNFVPGKIESVDSVLVGIGGGVILRKSRTDAVAVLDGRLSEIQKHVEELTKQFSSVEAQLSRIQPQLEAMLQGR